MSYSAPSNDAVNLSGSRVYSPPANDDVLLMPIVSGGLPISTTTDSSTMSSETKYIGPSIVELIDIFIENNPNLGLLITDYEVAYYVARTIVNSVDEFLDEVEAERQQQFVATASGEGLDQLGELVGARRQTGESDEAMRVRVQARFGQATSETTIEDLAQITRTITGASASQIELAPPTDDVLVVIVRLNSGIVNDSPFTLTELGDFLSDVVPASHAVEVRTTGTFILDGPDFTPPPNSGLGDGNGTLGGTSR